MRPLTYILVNFEPVPIDTSDREQLVRYAKFMEDTDQRRVNESRVGPFHVSTVFLGVDHGWRNPAPVLFETMIFGAPEGHALSDYQDRCCTWQEAEAMHRKAWKLAIDAAKELIEQNGVPN